MHFSIVALFAAGALASVCPAGLFSNPVCCATSILDIIGLDCNTPRTPFTDGASMQKVCAASGKQPLCCVAPAANQAVLCTKPVGAI